ncbi:P-type DNA transfer ATPase VirB11 [Herbaspirillum sp. SJZ107]|uniref:P-type DNA transfer ATPase VirB11 n=1 Tax=Herbaspirillum sp. SJZ107 TaxID=2572881 RepID=UPI00114ECBF7|nr:P-type DNA transfer ATPase VirB11 [Herbaspirillum sp. SJZ107]TQK03415.1 type IV secretion system protein VirB11 [Herbaspirillum sp. SJZ107]
MDLVFEGSNEKSTVVLALEPLSGFLADADLTEIVINRPGIVAVERRGYWESHRMPALDFDWCFDLAKLLRNRSSQDITEAQPLLGAQLPDGQRVQIVIPPAVPTGTVSITIRRPGSCVLSLRELVDAGAFECAKREQSLMLGQEERGTLEDALPESDRELLALFNAREWERFLALAVACRKNIVSSGATGSGKTTLGNALAALVPLHERIVTVEDVPEMRLPHENQVNLFYPKGGNGVSKLRPRDLLEAALRMRPDRVLLAELRGDESFFFIQNVLNSGHPGTITTVHATRAKLAFRRLALMIKGSQEGSGLDLSDITTTLHALVDVVLQMERLPDGRRIVSEVYFDPAFAMRQLG